MADEEEMVEGQETSEDEPKKKSVLKKFGDYIEKDNKKWENGGAKKPVKGRELDAEEKGKIRDLAIDFWNNYGKDNQDKVESWANHPKGQKLIKHFISDGKCQDLYTNCDAYKNCFDAYQKVNGDKNYNYDESCVDFNRIQTPYDVSFYIVLDGFPDWLLSVTNQHTKNFVMSRFNEGESILSIVKTANEKLGKTADKKGDKDAQENGNESESKDDKEQSQESEEEQKEHKHELDVYCATCAKKDVPTRIVYGDLSKQFNEYQRGYLKTFVDSGKKLSEENTEIFNNLKDTSFAETYFSAHKELFDLSIFDNTKKPINNFSEQTRSDKNYFGENDKSGKIDNTYADYLGNGESQNTTSETGFEQ